MDSNALKNEFLVESFENLSSINEDITHYEKDANNKEILNKIYRTVHTMKGSASFLGYKKLQDLTHSAENLLDALREGLVSLHSSIVDSLLTSFDLCYSILKSIEQNDSEGDTDISLIKSKLDYLLDPTSSEELIIEQIEEDDFEKEANVHTIYESQIEDNSEQSTDLADEYGDRGVSPAAMESLRELVVTGKVDAELMDDIEKTTNGEIAQIIDEPEERAINQAALDSLKELSESGVIDSAVWQEVENGDTSELKVESSESSQEVPMIKNNTVEDQLSTLLPVKEVFQTNELLENSRSIADSIVRVNVNVLDNIMNLVGELVLNRNQVLQYSNVNNEKQELSRLSQQLNSITSELQEQVMSTRMQPIGTILTKFERLVRDFSKTHNKKINLKLTGHETELDKTLIEAIRDPLVHIVRNSVDHGIESLETRKELGKTPEGIVEIKAYNESGQVTIEVLDDGQGLCIEKIKEKALEKNLRTAEELSNMSEQQLFGLIFMPGFTTASEVTDISGRGVGMDVVKTNVEKIGGNITVTSERDRGTSFKMRIPLTLAIVPALIIRNNGQSFAIPQLNLVELVRLESSDELAQIENISGSEFLRLRNNLTPLFRLEECLGLKDVQKKHETLLSAIDDSFTNSSQIDLNQKQKEKHDTGINIAILNAENNYYGVIVDEILDTEEIVVKPIESIKNLNIFSGATIMGDGSVSLILDAFGFLNQFTTLKDFKKENDLILNKQLDTIEQNGEMLENILIKLFDERTYAVPLQLVSRLEEFSVDKIEKVGLNPVIRYLDKPMMLINLEKSLGLNAHSSLDTYKEDNLEKILCVVTTIRGVNYGLVVKEILDIAIDKVDIDDSAVDREGILGTIFLQGKTVSLIDLYAIFNEKDESFEENLKSENLNSTKAKRVLLVDDSAMYRKMESDALSSFGYIVDTGINGEDGLVQLENNEYDLIITDIEMPVLDGFEFIKQVRQNEKFSNVPVIALSTRTSVSDREKGKQAGFDHHLEKFRKDEVLKLVSDILRGN